MACGAKRQPQRILLLDPGGSEPSFQAFNARLRLSATGTGSRQVQQLPLPADDAKLPTALWHYESESWSAELVRLLAAVRVRKLQ